MRVLCFLYQARFFKKQPCGQVGCLVWLDQVVLTAHVLLAMLERPPPLARWPYAPFLIVEMGH